MLGNERSSALTCNASRKLNTCTAGNNTALSYTHILQWLKSLVIWVTVKKEGRTGVKITSPNISPVDTVFLDVPMIF